MKRLSRVSTARLNSWIQLALFATAVVAATFGQTSTASAASLSRTLVRFDRLKVSTQTTGTVCVTPASTATEADVQVVFPASYTLGLAATFTVNTTNLAWPATAQVWPGINTATNVTSQTVTFPSGDLTAGTLYCFNWTNAAAVTVKAGATNPNSGTVTTRTSTPTNIDTGNYSTASITDDQIQVSAAVAPTFSFAIDNNSDNLGTLSTASVTSSPTPRNVTVSTNTKNGWYVWAKDANTGLNSTTVSSTIASATPGSNSTITTAAAAYNTGVTFVSQTGGTGTVTIDPIFLGGSSGKGGGLDTTNRLIASSNGSADTAVIRLTNNATIVATTPAANDYADTITLTGAGLF